MPTKADILAAIARTELGVDTLATRTVGTYVVFVTFPGRQASVGLDHADGLELLSFLSDALGVTGTTGPTP